MVKDRRRSVSSSSSSSSSSDDEHGHKRKQKGRKNVQWDSDYTRTGRAAPANPNFAPAPQRDVSSQHNAAMSGPGFPTSPPPYAGDAQSFVGMPNEQHFVPPSGPPPFPSADHDHERSLHIPSFPGAHQPTAPRAPSPDTQHLRGQPPSSGFRVPLSENAPFPTSQAAQPVAHDADGVSPIFMGSALMDRSVHPCKIAPALTPACRVPYGGQEMEHHGRYDLLPFDPNTMEWVHTSQGRIPQGRRPVEGGYEESGPKLYHALGVINGVKVPGKTGEHLVRLTSRWSDD